MYGLHRRYNPFRGRGGRFRRSRYYNRTRTGEGYKSHLRWLKFGVLLWKSYDTPLKSKKQKGDLPIFPVREFMSGIGYGMSRLMFVQGMDAQLRKAQAVNDTVDRLTPGDFVTAVYLADQAGDYVVWNSWYLPNILSYLDLERWHNDEDNDFLDLVGADRYGRPPHGGAGDPGHRPGPRPNKRRRSHPVLPELEGGPGPRSSGSSSSSAGGEEDEKYGPANDDWTDEQYVESLEGALSSRPSSSSSASSSSVYTGRLNDYWGIKDRWLGEGEVLSDRINAYANYDAGADGAFSSEMPSSHHWRKLMASFKQKHPLGTVHKRRMADLGIAGDVPYTLWGNELTRADLQRQFPYVYEARNRLYTWLIHGLGFSPADAKRRWDQWMKESRDLLAYSVVDPEVPSVAEAFAGVPRPKYGPARLFGPERPPAADAPLAAVSEENPAPGPATLYDQRPAPSPPFRAADGSLVHQTKESLLNDAFSEKKFKEDQAYLERRRDNYDRMKAREDRVDAVRFPSDVSSFRAGATQIEIPQFDPDEILLVDEPPVDDASAGVVVSVPQGPAAGPVPQGPAAGLVYPPLGPIPQIVPPRVPRPVGPVPNLGPPSLYPDDDDLPMLIDLPSSEGVHGRKYMRGGRKYKTMRAADAAQLLHHSVRDYPNLRRKEPEHREYPLRSRFKKSKK